MIRAINHADIKALTLTLSAGEVHAAQYLEIKNEVLKQFPPKSKQDNLREDTYVSNKVAEAFEWLLPIDAKIISRGDIPKEVSGSLEIAENIIEKNQAFFGEGFWDREKRELRIREALANGVMLYQTADPEDDVLPEDYTIKIKDVEERIEGDKQNVAATEEAFLERAGNNEDAVLGFIKYQAETAFGASEDDKKKQHLSNLLENAGRPWDKRSQKEKGWFRELQSLLRMKHDVSGRKDEDLTGKTLSDISSSIQPRGPPLRNRGMVFLPKEGTAYVIGDIHGDIDSLEQIIAETGFEEKIKTDKNVFLVFTGDYVNNGLANIETLLTVLRLKKEYFNNVILLSGNHEFREGYMTALNECYKTHWDNASGENKYGNKLPEYGRHYGNIRLELISRFGIIKGEQIYREFEAWGRSLPYICCTSNGAMMSHSIGLLTTNEKEPQIIPVDLEKLAAAKEDKSDIALLKKFGYEYWKKSIRTIHARMVNGMEAKEGIKKREIIGVNGLLEQFNDLGFNKFIVGHTHFRSGNIQKGNAGELITVCSSDENSPSAGHYMHQELELKSQKEVNAGKQQKKAETSYLEIDLAAETVDLESSRKTFKYRNDFVSLRPETKNKWLRDDVSRTGMIQNDILKEVLENGDTYIIRYDESRLLGSYQEVLKQYVRLLNSQSRSTFKAVGYKKDDADRSDKGLIYVEKIKKGDKEASGNGRVDVKIPSDKKIENYFLRITGMVNIALAAANLPKDLPQNINGKNFSEKYASILGFIKNQYKVIVGEDLVLEGAPNDILKKLRHIVLILPKAYRMSVDIDTHNELVRKMLVAA